ncbi:MAG: RNA methyltransferase [Chloroflexota bacterium]|nr:MAG: RNA methyltransferase [Chloroflexota bacterium]
MAPGRIESVGRGSEPVRSARALRQRSERQVRSEFLAEGEKLVRDAIHLGAVPRAVYARRTPLDGGTLDTLIQALPSECRLYSVEDRVFDSMCDTRTPGAVAAVFSLPPRRPAAPGLALLLDGLQDPGNVGTMIRSAAACGAVSEVLCLGGADPFGPKAVRAAAAAIFVLSPTIIEPSGLPRLSDRRVIVASAHDGKAYQTFAWRLDDVLVIGSEGSGESAAIRAIATDRVTIPLAPGVESLNAAIAASILLFSVTRHK